MTAMQTKPQQGNKALTDLRGMLEQAVPKLKQVAATWLSVDRMIRLLLSASSRNPDILKCSTNSVLNFAMKCAETGLEPIGPGGCWPIAFGNRKNGTTELTFVPDYRGLVNCAKRSQCILDAYAEVVRANDMFDYEFGDNPRLIHKPARSNRGDLEAAYCTIVLPDGSKRFVVMEKEDILHIRDQHSAAWRNKGASSMWGTDPGEMWKKTVTRRAMKQFVGMSAHLDAAMEADDSATFQISERPPVPMPRAIGESPPQQISEVVAVPVEESHVAEPDAAPSDAELDADDLFESFSHEIDGIADPTDAEELRRKINDSASTIGSKRVAKLLAKLNRMLGE